MPRVLHTGGVNLSGDAVKIRDLALVRAAPAAKPKPRPKAEAPDDEDGAEALGRNEDEGEPSEADFIEARFEEAAPPFRPAAVGEAASERIREEIIQSAMAEAGRILEDAVRSGEVMKNDLLAGVAAEAEALRNQAVEEGKREAYTAFTGEMRQIADNLQGAIARFEGERAGFEAEYEEQLKWMAIEIASKVLAKKVSDDDAIMADMVDKAVRNIRGEPWIRVEVAQEMQGLIDRLSSLYESQAGIEVSPIPAPPGTVHIETPSGVVDASLRTQLANLRGYFDKI